MIYKSFFLWGIFLLKYEIDLLTCLQVSVQGSTESMRSGWFLSMARWRVWSPVAWKAGAGALAAWETAWTDLVSEPWWPGAGSWIVGSQSLSGYRQCKPGQNGGEYRLVSHKCLCHKARGNFSHCQCVLWVVAQICLARLPLLNLASLFTHGDLRP